jgi:hypothetical protein
MYDGDTTRGTYGYRSSSSATSYHSASYFTWTYNNGTLTVKTSSSTNGGNFSSSVTYQLAYVVATEGSLGGSTGDMQLPTLTNAGVSADLALGKQLIDGSGNLITGTHECTTVQRYPTTGTGSVNIRDSGTTVNCGFKPDVIFLTDNRISESSYPNHKYVAGVDFVAANTDKVCLALYPNNDNYLIYDLVIDRTTTGFKIYAVGINWDWDETSIADTLSYTAVKYTE